MPVYLMNREEIDKLPGELRTFNASYENENSRNMSWPGVPVLQVKHRCKVMLVWNKWDDLRNGSFGVFIAVREDVLLVLFEGVGIVEIGRETWIKSKITALGECGAFDLAGNKIFGMARMLRTLISETKFLYTTPPPTQHHSFFRSYSFYSFFS